MKTIAVWLMALALGAAGARAQSYYNMTAADFLRGGPARTQTQGHATHATKVIIQNKAPGTVQYAIRFGSGAWKTVNLLAGNQITHSGYGTPSTKFSNLSRLVTYSLRPKSVNAFVLAGPQRLDLIADPNVVAR